MRMAFCLLSFASVWACAADLPESAARLQSFIGDPDRFVAELRAFDKEQFELARKERETAQGLSGMGQADQARQKMDQARERLDMLRSTYEFAISQYTSNARVHNYYGELLYDGFGEFPGALREWNLALSYDKDLSAAHNNLGIHYFHNGAFAAGLRHLDAAIKLDRKNPDYAFNLAQMYLVYTPDIKRLRGWEDKKVYKEAMALSKKAAANAPEDFDLLKDYALNFFTAERFGVKAGWKDSAKAWQAARAKARNADEVFHTWLYEARAWIRAGKTAEATVCLEEALKLNPGNAVVRRLLEGIEEKDAA